MKTNGIIRLGELIEILEGLPDSIFDAPLIGWGDLISWRGNYADLTLTDSDVGVPIKVALMQAQQALEIPFEGYKGGEYWMTPETLIWGDEYGEATQNYISGIAFVLDKEDKYKARAQVLRVNHSVGSPGGLW